MAQPGPTAETSVADSTWGDDEPGFSGWGSSPLLHTMADPSTTRQKRAADVLAEAKRRTAEQAERKARAQQPGPALERVARDETADARKARQNADVMAAAEDGLAIARASREPRKIRDAIAALHAARVFTGDSQPVTGHVSVIIEGMDEPDDDDVPRGDSSVATSDQIQ